jgi:hypothetical protein
MKSIGRKTFSIQFLYKIYIYRKIIGSIVSLIIFLVLFVATIVGLPIVLAEVKRKF